MTVHKNSVAAYHEEKKKLSTRALLIAAWVQMHGRSTDRQVMIGMGFSEPNAVRPRITELVDAGELVEVDSVRCEVTGKTVRVVERPTKQLELLAA